MDRLVLLALVFLSLVPAVAFGASTFGVMGDKLYFPGQVEVRISPGEYPVVSPFPKQEVGVITLPEVPTYLSLVEFSGSNGGFIRPDGYLWRGYLFVHCLDYCDVNRVNSAVLSRLPVGTMVGPVVVASHRNGGELAVVPVFGAYYRTSPYLYYEFPEIVADFNGYILRFVPSETRRVVSLPSSLKPLTPGKVPAVRTEVEYGVVPSGGRVGTVTFYTEVNVLDDGYSYELFISPDGSVYRVSLYDVNSSPVSLDKYVQFLNIAGRCNFTTTDLEKVGVRISVYPEAVVRPDIPPVDRLLYVQGVECAQESMYYPMALSPAGKNQRVVSHTDIVLFPYGNQEVLAVLLVPYKTYYLPFVFESDLIRVAVSQSKTGEEVSQPVPEEREGNVCLVDIPLTRVSVVSVDSHPVVLPDDTPFPKAVHLRLNFERECNLDDSTQFVVHVYGPAGEREWNYTFPGVCSGGVCDVTVHVPLVGYPRVSVFIVNDRAEYQHEVYTFVADKPCVGGQTFLDFRTGYTTLCSIRCTSQGCDEASELVQASEDLLSGTDPVGSTVSLWKQDLLGALLYGAMGTATLVLSQRATLAELAALGGLPVAAAAVLLEFAVFAGAYFLARRCLGEEGMKLWTFGSLMIAPFFGSLGAVGTALVGCLFSHSK